jgi:hypothetical protein
MDDKVVEVLSRGYHNAINRHWSEKFGTPDLPWDTLPETAPSRIENKQDIRDLMRQAIVHLEESGYRIIRAEN